MVTVIGNKGLSKHVLELGAVRRRGSFCRGILRKIGSKNNKFGITPSIEGSVVLEPMGKHTLSKKGKKFIFLKK